MLLKIFFLPLVALRLCRQGAARTPLTSKPPLYTVLTATLGQDFHLTPNSVQLGPAARMGLVSLFHLPSHVFPPACCPDNLTQGLQHPARLGHSLKPHRHSVRHARGNKQGDDFSGWLDWVRCNVKPRFHPPLFLLKADIEQKRRCPRGCSCAPRLLLCTVPLASAAWQRHAVEIQPRSEVSVVL